MAFTARTETYLDAASLDSPYDATVDKPTNTAEDDILFAFVCFAAAGVSIDSAPSGWTKAGDYTDNNDKYALYYKVAGDSEPSDYTWSFDATCKVRITCSCYTGDYDTADPIDVLSNTPYRAQGTIVRAASMSVSAANSPMVFFGALFYTVAVRTYTPPSAPDTWTEDDDSGSADSDFSCTVCSLIWDSSGATGDMDAIIANTFIVTRHAFAVALNPVAGGWSNISHDKGVAAADMSHKKGVAVADISHVKGVAV